MRRTFDEVVEIFLRMLQGFIVSNLAFAPDVEVRIESAVQRQHFDLEILADQQRQGAFGRSRTCRVGIEVHDNVLAEASQQPCLQLRERRSRTGDHVVITRCVDGDAIHLAFDQDRVFEFADRLFRFVQVEQHARLGVDRRLRRVQILGTGLLVGRRACGR